MRYTHLLHAFYGVPWHLRSNEWLNFHAVLQRALAGQEVTPPPRPVRASLHRLQAFATAVPVLGPLYDDGTPMVPQMEIVGPVAIIPVHGALGKHLNGLDLMCGGCDYAYVSQFVELAAQDPSVAAAILDFNSPGGQSAGCGECAATIAALTAEKYTIAYTDNLCCSAAYWLASQCDDLWASPTAQIGNVGTILCDEDDSGAWQIAGRKLELFASSPLKATGVSGKPWTPEDRAYLQERLQQCDARIKSGVRSGRPQIIDEALDGRWFFAENSLDLGVCDALANDLDEVLAVLLG